MNVIENPKPYLSIVITAFNDNDELALTVASIKETAGDIPEIVVVDDCSLMPVRMLPGVKIVRNARRIGCGPSRYVGAMHAQGEYLMFTDSHCRFNEGWFLGLSNLKPKTLYCGNCYDLANPNGAGYFGADFNLCGPDKKYPRLNQVLECVWAIEKPEDEYEIQAVMGACYFIHRAWFVYLDALRHLRVWGGDEQELSLKAWLAGGSVRLLKKVRIGHKFRTGKVSPNFVMPWQVLLNKLFIAHTCLPTDKAMMLQMKMHQDLQFGIAIKAFRETYNEVEASRAYNNAIFEMDFGSLLSKFGLIFPSK